MYRSWNNGAKLTEFQQGDRGQYFHDWLRGNQEYELKQLQITLDMKNALGGRDLHNKFFVCLGSRVGQRWFLYHHDGGFYLYHFFGSED